MSTKSKRKGTTYEREIARLVGAQRNYQHRAGDGADIIARIGAHTLAIECKRRRSLSTIHSWMQQAIANARDGEIPVVVMRQDGGENLVLLRLSDFVFLLQGRAPTRCVN
ncbi:MAG: hypothetical protein KatS3mg038_2518 [Candidatus Kapaibacterium sp.]|nr:MAG: hypothetical protein KatS3mg038_2518 [Candidatus Kapabacteria bacterium]